MNTPRRPPYRQSSTDRRGGVTVELALTLPLFFSLLFGAFEFARVNTVLHTIENACYEGTRRAILPGATSTQSQTVAQDVLDAVGIADAVVTVTPTPLTGLEEEVTVEVSVPLNSNAWISPVFFKDASLTRSCTFSTEQRVPSGP